MARMPRFDDLDAARVQVGDGGVGEGLVGDQRMERQSLDGRGSANGASVRRLQAPMIAPSIPSCLFFFHSREKPATRSREARHHRANGHLRSIGNLTIGQPMKIA
jgi:hypothetical protein